MSLSFNDSGLITLGMGKDHRLCTIGMGITFEVGGGGVIPTWRHREYLFDLFATVFKKNSRVIKSYTPVKFDRDQVIMLSSPIQKEKMLCFKIISPINSEKLRKILNAL